MNKKQFHLVQGNLNENMVSSFLNLTITISQYRLILRALFLVQILSPHSTSIKQVSFQILSCLSMISPSLGNKLIILLLEISH